MQEMIVKLIKMLVDHPDEVSIKHIEGESTVVYEVQVHPEDAGKVIGKKGKTINALRTIVRAATVSGKKKIMMELV